MHNRKVFYDESFWERVEARLKNWVSIHFNYIIKQNKL